MTIHTRHPNSAKPDKDQSTACTITAVALLCVTVALASGSAIGQSQMVALPSGSAISQSQISQDRLVGTWAYESVVVERTNGTRVAPFGPDPKGFITLSADGRYSLQLIRPDIPKITSKDRLSGTAEENRAVAQGVVSQFGTYSVNEAEGTLTGVGSFGRRARNILHEYYDAASRARDHQQCTFLLVWGQCAYLPGTNPAFDPAARERDAINPDLAVGSTNAGCAR